MSCKSCEFVDALNTGQKWDKTDLNYYFYNLSDGLIGIDGFGKTLAEWTDTQKENYRTAIHSWDKVCELVLTEVYTLEEADIKLFLIDDASYFYLGHAWFPGDDNKGQVYVSLNNATDEDFTVGSYDYVTMVHELGHSFGLAHPHDNGGTSTLFPGVNGPWNLGTNQQNQTMFTVMSYNDLNGPLTPDEIQSYGFIKGPMAYDIFTIQKIYPGTVVQNEGNTTYTLAVSNQEGTFYEAILDTGGIDTISASGSIQGVTVNINAAKMDGSVGSGGFVSKVNGIDGGYTIANGILIENIIGGLGNDVLIGNHGNNNIKGGGGHDYIDGGNGTDTIDGGAGNDIIVVRRGRKIINGGSGRNTIVLPGTRRNYDIYRNSGSIVYTFKGRGRFSRVVSMVTARNFTWVKFMRHRRRTTQRGLRAQIRRRRRRRTRIPVRRRPVRRRTGIILNVRIF